MTEEDIKMWKEALGQQMRLERKSKGMTQKEVAPLVGLSQKTVSQIEKGENPTIDNYIKYCETLGSDFAVIAARARVVIRARTIGDDYLDGLTG